MESETTTIRLSIQARAILNEWSERTKIPVTSLMEEFTTALKQGLDQLDDDHKLLTMCDWDVLNKILHVRLSDSFGTPDQLGLPMKEVEQAFGYSRDPKTNALIDTREQPKKESA